MIGIRTLVLACLATTTACNGSPVAHRQIQLPNPVPPANADFDSAAVPPPSCVAGWQITLVPRVGSDPQWAVGPDGEMHIMYIGYGAGELALRHVAEKTAQQADTVSTTSLGSLAIAPDGTAHAFLAAHSGMVQSPERAGIVHMSRSSGGWVVDPAQVSSDGGPFNASAIDGDGHAHLAFGDGGLYYASNASGQWVKTAIGMQTQVSVFALEIDRSGHVHIWFNGIDPGGTAAGNHWASNASGQWRVAAMLGPDVAPAIDRHGVPHGITSVGKTGLDHVWWNGQRWIAEPLPELGNATVFDLRLDDNDKLHVLLESAANKIVYASNVSGGWVLEPVIMADTPGLVPSGRIGLDRNANPHIAFKGPLAGASFGFAKRCP